MHLVKNGQGGVADNLISEVSQCASAIRPVHTWLFTQRAVATHRVSNTFRTFSCKFEGM